MTCCTKINQKAVRFLSHSLMSSGPGQSLRWWGEGGEATGMGEQNKTEWADILLFCKAKASHSIVSKNMLLNFYKAHLLLKVAHVNKRGKSHL